MPPLHPIIHPCVDRVGKVVRNTRHETRTWRCRLLSTLVVPLLSYSGNPRGSNGSPDIASPCCRSNRATAGDVGATPETCKPPPPPPTPTSTPAPLRVLYTLLLAASVASVRANAAFRLRTFGDDELIVATATFGHRPGHADRSRQSMSSEGNSTVPLWSVTTNSRTTT